MKATATGISRRAVLGGLIAAPFVVRPAGAVSGQRRLAMTHVQTKETLSVAYWSGGRYDVAAWGDINTFLRDWHRDESILIDLRTLDIIHGVCDRLEHSGQVEILCGYRTPETNAALRRNNGGAARASFHLKGKAIDFRLPGQKLSRIRRAASAQKAGGVGYYPGSHFIHVDTGPVRSWRG